MGVSTNFLVYYGVKLPWNHELSERYEELYEEGNSALMPEILWDAMGMEYMIIGPQLFDFGDCRWSFETYDPRVTHSVGDVLNQAKIYTDRFIEWFPEFRHLVEVPFKFLTVQHFH